MAPKGEACAECTQNCLLMHKKEKNPSPVATSFVKVMFGDEYSKVLFLPPKFAHTVQKKSGRSTWLEDSNGEKWKVRFTKIDGLLAFEEGWNTFCLAHGLKVGDLLVFHYIMESYFVVSMYGESGCPENRHFGFTPHPMKETRKEHKLTTVDHHIPSNATTNGNHHHHLEIKDSVGSQQKEISIKKKITDDMMSPNTHDHLVASSSQSQPSDSDKEKSQRSKPLVNTNPDNTVCETPTIVKNNHSVPVQDSEDEHLGVNSLQKYDVSILQTSPKKSSGGRKDDVAAGGGGDGTKVKESGKLLETLSKKMTEKPKENTFKPSIKKRLRSTMFPMTPTKIVKKDSVLTSQTDVSGSKSRNDNDAPASSPKPIVSPPKMIKKESISACEHDSRFHNVGVPHKPIAKPMEMPNKSPPTLKRDSTGVMKTSSSGKRDFNNSHKEESNNILHKVKPEPVDYEDTPWTGPTNTSFSAVMSSYQYLEIPKWVKLKSKVILLRNKADLWPVLYQNKVGLKALTQSWEAFARQRGIQIGDNCEFVLESEANSNFTCSVFTVHVTSK